MRGAEPGQRRRRRRFDPVSHGRHRTLGAMGPNNPWSPQWRPDPTGRRLAPITAARRGALLAAVAYIPLAAAAIATTQLPRDLALLVLVIGSPGVALLGAGLAPAARGSSGVAVGAGA